MLNRRHVIAGLPFIGSATAAASVIEVTGAPGSSTGILRFGTMQFPCALGRSGIRTAKMEGDGATPAGLFPLRDVRYRPDHVRAPATGLPVFATNARDGWCDDPHDPAYNRLIRLPYPHSAEKMWRNDEAYDLLAVIGYNDAPVRPGAGSAIFLHVMLERGGRPMPTSGCVALRIDDLQHVIAQCRAGTMIRISSG